MTYELFNHYTEKYDSWYKKHPYAYHTELHALKTLLSSCPPTLMDIEIGVGTGRFAGPLHIRFGVEPAHRMASIARKRGVQVVCAVAESLPFQDEQFELVLFMSTLCFVQEPLQALKESTRILKKNGYIILGTVDPESFLGKYYQQKQSVFYRSAHFIPLAYIKGWFDRLNIEIIGIYQTLYHFPETVNTIEPIREGTGEGGIVFFKGRKTG